jgi:hypothetical protein
MQNHGHVQFSLNIHMIFCQMQQDIDYLLFSWWQTDFLLHALLQLLEKNTNYVLHSFGSFMCRHAVVRMKPQL